MEKDIQRTNSYTTPDPRDVNQKTKKPKEKSKSPGFPTNILYETPNTASPDATDPPVPNRAHTEM